MIFGNGKTKFKANERVKLATKKPTFYGVIKHFATKVRCAYRRHRPGIDSETIRRAEACKARIHIFVHSLFANQHMLANRKGVEEDMRVVQGWFARQPLAFLKY